jgi:large subunit ribosomal protein L10
MCWGDRSAAFSNISIMKRQEKKQLVEDLTDKFKKIKSAIFTDFTGLTAPELEELRKNLREKEIEYRVVKKTLLRRVYQGDIEHPGSIAVALSYDDEITPAKVLYNFSKEHESLKILQGVLDGEKIGLDIIERLAKLPSKEELLSKLVYIIKGNILKLILILKHVGEEKRDN